MLKSQDIQNDINNICEDFQKKIKSVTEVNPYRKARQTRPAFPILETANREYYEYNYFERILVEYVREYLVNPVLEYLFHAVNIDFIGPDPDQKRCVAFSNEKIEDFYPFEFRIKDGKKYIGIRYSSFIEGKQNAKSIIRQYKISSILIIRWGGKIYSFNNATVSKEIDVEDFLKSYFGDDVSSYLLATLKEAVRKANTEIGFQTIPRLSLRGLSEFKNQSAIDYSEIVFSALQYQIVDKNGNISSYSPFSLTTEDSIILEDYFTKEKLYESFYGRSDFAKCFITSEYLFSIFKEGNHLDYTSVICGYLKSVEQLVYLIFKTTLAERPSADVLMKRKNTKFKKKDYEYLNSVQQKKPDTGAWHVPFLPKNEKYFDITLAPLIRLLQDHPSVWRLSENAKASIIEILLKYSQECRNDHFHKDNINEYNLVKCIRNNTILIFYLLIGGCKLTNKNDKNKSILGISDSIFSKAYKTLLDIPYSQDQYIFVNDNTETKVLRLYKRHSTIYDTFGFIDDSSIQFAVVEDYAIGDYETFINNIPNDKLIILNKENNIPDQIWLIVKGSNEKRLVFQKDKA